VRFQHNCGTFHFGSGAIAFVNFDVEGAPCSPHSDEISSYSIQTHSSAPRWYLGTVTTDGSDSNFELAAFISFRENVNSRVCLNRFNLEIDPPQCTVVT
jgi:hypothetical protein